MPRTRSFFLAAALLVAAAPPARAQPGMRPQAGDRVRVRVVARPAGPVGVVCEAPVEALAGDTLLLARSGGCPLGAYVADVRIARGDRGSRASHAALGVLGGAVVGGELGRLWVGDGCRVAGCDPDIAVLGVTVLGAGAGALAGAVVGALLPAGTRWAPGGAPRPLRVAGLALRPGARVALGPGRRR